MKKNTLQLLLLVIVILLSYNAYSQSVFEVPRDVILTTKPDYAKYNSAIIGAANWIEQTDLDKEKEKRVKVNDFVMKWISGSPTVSVPINEGVMKLIGKNSQLLMVYMSSFAKTVLEHPDVNNLVAQEKAGITSIANVYKKGIEIQKNKELERVMRLTDSELDSYIAERFK